MFNTNKYEELKGDLESLKEDMRYLREMYSQYLESRRNDMMRTEKMDKDWKELAVKEALLEVQKQYFPCTPGIEDLKNKVSELDDKLKNLDRQVGFRGAIMEKNMNNIAEHNEKRHNSLLQEIQNQYRKMMELKQQMDDAIFSFLKSEKKDTKDAEKEKEELKEWKFVDYTRFNIRKIIEEFRVWNAEWDVKGYGLTIEEFIEKIASKYKIKKR